MKLTLELLNQMEDAVLDYNNQAWQAIQKLTGNQLPKSLPTDAIIVLPTKLVEHFKDANGNMSNVPSNVKFSDLMPDGKFLITKNEVI